MTSTERLPASRCPACEHLSCPPRRYCSVGCGARTVPADVDAGGTLYASTIVHVPHPEYGAGYQVAYVDLDAGPRLFGHVAADELLAIGTRVRARLAHGEGAEAGGWPRVVFAVGEGRR